MERRPPPHGQREEFYQPPRGGPPPRPRSYQHRKENVYDAPSVEDILEQVTALQHAVDRLVENQPAKGEVLGAVHTLEAAFKERLADYYSAGVVDAKLAEQAQLWRSAVEDVHLKLKAERPDEQTAARIFLRAFWNTWQAKAVLYSVMLLAAIFGGDILVILISALAHK